MQSSSGQWPRRWAVLALALGLLLVAVYAWRAWRQHEYQLRLEAGEVQVETLRGWMTLSYIARVHGVPEAQIRSTLGLPAQGGDNKSLREWLDDAGIDPVRGRQAVETLILRQTPSGTGVRP